MRYPESFAETTLVHGPWSILWEYIGEGYSGDYNPSDPGDRPLLRANLRFKGKDVDNGSYCTLAHTGTSRQELARVSKLLFNALPATPSESYKQAIEGWTWQTEPIRSHRSGKHGYIEGLVDYPEEPSFFHPTTFGLHIDLGNEAMQTGDDVADALEQVARKLRRGAESGAIMDRNGNRVGIFNLLEE